ncbi:unnamed protein product [Caenorhabditis bovis]|uniref:G-protein coupled receptors family 1 profile domain-containing protein n=1 Tax=Caenorhabditis bovis TaxID=2654633 RepID=A0A8S1F7V3_9PELO|nr:unnamed protein product [Caenorhabditis bovis]
MTHNLTHLAQECEKLLTTNEVIEVRRRNARLDKSTSTVLIMTPIFALVSFVFSLVLLAAVIFALLKRRIPSRKYSIIVSRTVADIFSSVLIAAAALFANSVSASHMILTLFVFVCTFGIVHLTGSHCAVIVLRHISVTRPYGFQSICSMRKMFVVVFITWTLAIVYAVSFAPFISIILNPEKENQVCRHRSCQRPLMITAIFIISLSMFTVISTYFTVVIKMANIAHSEKMHNEPEITRKRMYKFFRFGGHLALFALIVSLILAGAIYTMINASEYHQIHRMLSLDCDVLDYVTLKLRMETVAAGAVILWCVRIIFDVVIVFFSEIRLVPWLKLDSGHYMESSQIVSVRHGLGWQKGCVNCPVFNVENRLHPLDFKN